MCQYKKKIIALTVILISLPITILAQNSEKPKKEEVSPNVIFISVDDMNDWVGYLDGYQGEVFTPNIDKLAKNGVAFTNAHVPAPVCNPSRTAILTGLRPSKTGIYGNNEIWVPNLPDVVTIPKHFKNNGYYVVGGGKNFHQPPGFNPPDQWNEYFKIIYDDPWNDHSSLYHSKLECSGFCRIFKELWVTDDSFSSLAGKKPNWFPRSGLSGEYYPNNLSNNFDWGGFDKGDLEMGDGRMVHWAIDFLNKKHFSPFFLGVGIFRPHQPWYVPQKYFDLYPLKEIKTPAILDGDLDDIPDAGRSIANSHTKDIKLLKRAGKYKEAIQAYLASISYADALVGYLLDALEKTPYADNTIIVLWSDHGWHLGEKEAWKKNTLWEESTRVPFIIYDPRNNNGFTCNKPVNVIDTYPTLIELCNLPKKPELDGTSLVSLMQRPEIEWDRPVLTTHSKGSHSLRNERWRYIRYENGSEELYDHKNDPNEWTNLSNDPKHKNIKIEMAKYLPKEEAEPAKGMDLYYFDIRTYRWLLKPEFR